jgi:soluble P-type ATPase
MGIVASSGGMGYVIVSFCWREALMLRMEIPGKGAYSIEFLVLDMDGTIAVDGRISARCKDKINLLAKRLKVYILTADTRGDAQKRWGHATAELVRIEGEDGAEQKKKFVSRIGAAKTIAVGNGYNDHLMVQEAALGIAVIGREGAAKETVCNADVAVTEITDALDFILKPLRHQATLRR